MGRRLDIDSEKLKLIEKEWELEIDNRIAHH